MYVRDEKLDRRRRVKLGGSGGMLSHKISKLRIAEMP